MLKRTAALTVTMLLTAAAWGQNTTAPAAPANKTTAQPAQAAKLTIGDKAPAVSVEKWVKGEPVTGFEKGNVYVVEFWATWCGPCKESMPHLTELQKEYKDKNVRIIGVTKPDTRGNTLEAVEKMTQEKGDAVMGYTVAWDGEAKTNAAYMKAADQRYIPCAFIVDREGRVAYIGDPREMDETLAQVVEGKHDLTKARQDYDKRAEAQRADAEKQAGVQKFGAQFESLMRQGKSAEAAELAAKNYDTVLKDSPELLNFVAWGMVDPDARIEKRDADLAIKYATRASELTKGERGEILDTLARAYYWKGDLQKAIEVQKQAVAKATPQFEADLKKALKEYEDAAQKK